MSSNIWNSPDGKITKEIINTGTLGLKPTENCKCCVKLSNNSVEELAEIAQNSSYIVGDSDTIVERLLDNCLMSMNVGEIANVTFKLGVNYTFTLELVNFETENLIHEWSAAKKFDLALKHKFRGVELFHESQYSDASHRFGKALKILCSIPIEVDRLLLQIDGISLTEINGLKVNLYNNLASCFLKCCDYQSVLELCQKIFEIDKSNVKALYKYGVATCELQDYEKSQKSFLCLLEVDPDNKAAAEKLKYVNTKVTESNARVNGMIKKMFKK